MNEGQLLGIVALAGSLILVVSGYRAHRVGAGRTVVFVLAWGAIIAACAAVFSAVS